MNRMSPEEHDPLSLNYYATVDARVMWNMASWWTNQNWLSHLSSVPGYVAGQNTNGFNLGGRGFFFNIGGGSWTSQYESQLWGGPMERANGSFTLAQGIKTNGSATTNDGNIIELTYQNVGPQIIWESVFSTNASDQNRMMPVRCVMDDDGPMVRSESATHLTDSSMRLNASFQFEGYRALSSTGFKWGYQADLSDASDVAGDTLGGPFSSELTGLSSGVTIHYSAYAMDSLGRISYGDTLSQYLMSCENVEIDGHLYQTAMIGNQCWFTEDLQTSTYRDGSAITEVNYNCGDTGTEPCWGYLPVGGSGSPQSYTAFVSYNGKKFYTYNAALGTLHGGICPIGWHLPTSYDWNQLATGFTAGFGESTWTPATFQGQGTGYASYDEIEEQVPFDPVTFTGGYTIYKTAFSMVELDHAAYWTGTNNNAVKWIETDNAYTESVTDAYFGLQIRCIRDADTIPIVTTELDYSGMTDSTAMFSASLEFNWVPMTSTGFIWGYSPDLSDASSITADTLAGNFQAELTGRSRLDTLYFSAFATNFLGTTYGDTLSVVVRYHGCGPATTFDYDGYSYNVFSRGDQCWFAENLRNDHYSDGTVIPGELDNSAWVSDTDGAQGFLSNDSTYLNTNGRLYNWHAVNNTHGLCPSGWHVTSDEEFTELTNQYGGQYTAGNALKASPSDFPAWDGTNTSGFSAMLTSYRQTNGTYQPAGNGYYWTSTSANSTQAWYRMFYNVTNSVYRGQNSVLYGYAARCVSDGALCHDPLATNYQLSGECDY